MVPHLRSLAIQLLSNILRELTKSTSQFCEFNTLKVKRLKLEYCSRNLKLLSIYFEGEKRKRSQRRKALRLRDGSSANVLAGNNSRPFCIRVRARCSPRVVF